MEEVKVHPIEKKVIGTVYRMLQRLNPFTYYYVPIISNKTKECSDEEHINADFHWHSIFSDGDPTPEHSVDTCYKRNIKVGSGSDHCTLEHWNYYREAEKMYPDFVYIPGIEVATNAGDLIALFPSYECKELECVKDLVSKEKISIEETINKVHEAGGVVIAPHPNKYRGIGLRKLKELKDKLDGVEEINIEAGEHNYLGKSLGLTSIATSDAHSKINLGSGFSKLPKSYFKDCYDKSGKIIIDKDKFRNNVIDLIKDEKSSPGRIIPCEAVNSLFEENIAKTTYANPFSLWLKVVEYFFDKRKVVAKRLTACLKKEPKE
jgi:predicted metal-dependent phosphoesterase TrpH